MPVKLLSTAFLIITLFIFMLFPFSSYAEPSSTVKFLMKEPVSLFDLGLYNLNKKLDAMDIFYFSNDDSLEMKSEKLSTYVHYDWDKNKILISSDPATLLFYTSDVTEAKRVCKEIVKRIRAELIIDQENPTIDNDVSEMLIHNLFSHRGYKRGKEPDNLDEELMKIMEINSLIRYKVKSDDKKNQSNIIKCKTPIMSKEVYYSE